MCEIMTILTIPIIINVKKKSTKLVMSISKNEKQSNLIIDTANDRSMKSHNIGGNIQQPIQ